MKNVPVLLFVICTGSIVHAMEQKQVEPACGIDYSVIERTLNDDYKNYARNRLAEYKKTDFTPDDIKQMIEMRLVFSTNPGDS